MRSGVIVLCTNTAKVWLVFVSKSQEPELSIPDFVSQLVPPNKKPRREAAWLNLICIFAFSGAGLLLSLFWA